MVSSFFRLSIVAAIFCLGSLAKADTQISAVHDFEGAVLPKGWQAGPENTISLAGERYKAGSQSLRWEWRGDRATLTYRNASDFAKLSAGGEKGGSTLGLWIYNEQPLHGMLRLELLNGEEVVGQCWYWLNFRGWRPVGALYSQVGWTPGRSVDGVRFSLPEGSAAGRLYFDYACFNFISKGPKADYQQPWAAGPEGLKPEFPDAPERTFYSSHDLSLNRPWLPPLTPAENITPQQQGDLRHLSQYYRDNIAFGAAAQSISLEELRSKVATYQIHRENGVITGRPVDQGGFLVPPRGIKFSPDYSLTMIQTYELYKKAKGKNVALADELKGIYFDLLDHLLDQGWMEGNGNLGWLGIGYDLRHFPRAIFGMREEIEASGRTREVALAIAWLMCGDEMAAQSPTFSTDMIYNFMAHLPGLIFMLPDASEQLQRMQVLQRCLNIGLSETGPLKPDGTVHHHWMFHIAYGSYAIPSSLRALVEPLHGTSFQINPAAHQRLRTFVRSMAFALDRGQVLTNLNARAGSTLEFNVADSAGILAGIGEVDGSDPLDREMAAIFLAVNDKPDAPLAETLRGKEIAPWPLSGHLTLNTAAASIQRRDHWLAAMVGMREAYRGLEIYGWMEINNYARYARNGSLLLGGVKRPGGKELGGFQQDGWDWFHWPGATSLVHPQQQRIFDGYTMYNNKSDFAGGTDLDGDGVWGMDGETVDLRFRKSAFFFGSRMTVVTSGVKPSLNLPAVTTLYQNALAKPREASWVDGVKVKSFPYKATLSDGQPHWLLDNKGTGYYIPGGQPALQLARRPQEWTYLISKYLKDPKKSPIIDIRNKKFREPLLEANEPYFNPSKGDFALAWFEHTAEADASVYTLLVNSNAEAMKEYAAAMAESEGAPTCLLQKDVRGHIVRDTVPGEDVAIGYVLFEANAALPKESPIASNSRSCMAMVKVRGDELRLSVASTEVKRRDPFILKLRGGWTLKSSQTPRPCTVQVEGGETRVEIPYEDEMPMRFVFHKIL